MLQNSPGHRPLRQAAGALGAVALIALGAAPAVAADDTGAQVTLGRIAPFDGVKPGSTIDVPATFTNTGTAAADKVWMDYEITRGLSHTELPSNCLRYEVASFDEAPSKSEAVCEFDQTVRPGTVYAPEKALTLKVLDHALYDRLRVSVSTSRIGPEDGWSEPVRGTGAAVKLVEQPGATPAAPRTDSHPDWDAADVKVTAANTADFQVKGAELKGAVGDTVALSVKFTNAGPGWVLRDLGVPAAKVKIKMPAGTTVTKTYGYCDKVASGSYECGTSQSWINEGSSETYVFKLRIDKAASGAKGSVTLGGLSRPFDKDKSDDTAAITLDVSGSGSSTGGDGSSDGGATATPGGSGSSSTGGSGSTGGSSTGGSSTGGTSTDSVSGGDLASTGSGSVLPIAGAATAAVGLGAGAVLLARRRRAAQR